MATTPEEDLRIGEQLEVLHSMHGIVAEQLKLLLPANQAWQPTDYLPDMTAPDWHDQLLKFRASAEGVSDEALVVIVGDMVTEEALPNYAISLNLVARDYAGDSQDPWAVWMRGWTSEENRHGDLLNAYLRLTGRVDMRKVELTVHHLIANGFNPKAYPDPYAGLIYTSFQERATKVSHNNVGKLAERDGDANIARICKKIAGDESRHERFYTLMMGEVMKRDPAGGVLVFRDMLRRIIAMPGRLMDDGTEPDLFERFANVAQRLGVYTVHDYAGIIEHLVRTWNIGSYSLNDKAAKAQEFLCRQAERLHGMAEAVSERVAEEPQRKFSWIYDRKA